MMEESNSMEIESPEIDNINVSTTESSQTSISLDRIESNVVLTQFANCLKDFRLATLNQDSDTRMDTEIDETADPFQLVRSFKSIAAQQAIVEFDTGSDSYVNWELETKLWHLTEILLTYRHSSEDDQFPSYSFSSHLVHQENHLNKSRKLKELWLIINWINENSPTNDDESDTDLETNLESKWFNTKLNISNNKFNSFIGQNQTSLVDELDSDAPLRSNKKIHNRDEKTDSTNFRKVYNLLKSNRVQDAIELCNNTENWTLAIILSGIQDHLDPDIDSGFTESTAETGNKHKYLWRKTVYKLSTNENISIYERAIYSFLCGDLSNCLKISNTWEDHLLIYLNNIFQSEIENSLIKSGKIPESDLKQVNINVPKNNFSTIEEVLNILSNSTNPKIKEDSENSIRVLIGSVMVNKIGHIINNSLKLVNNIIKGRESSNEVTSESYLLRILTHFAIFISIINPSLVSKKDVSRLVVLYITRLSLYSLKSLIPIYVSFLPETEARESYSFFLSSLYDPQQRQEQLLLARTFGLPLENILKKTVSRVFEDTRQGYEPNNEIILSNTNDISQIDKRLYTTVEWFYESAMYADAIQSTIILIRRFLLCGKISALMEFSSRHSFRSLVKNYDVLKAGNLSIEISAETREELLQYDELVIGLNNIDEWDNFYSKSKLTEKSWKANAVTISIDKITTILNKLILNWLSNLTNSPTSHTTKISSIHIMSQKGLKPYNVQEKDLNVLNELRSIYIPHLIFELQRILQEARHANWVYMKHSIELVNLVVDDRFKLYTLFQNCGRLKEFLVKSSELSALAFGRDDNGIFDSV